MGRAATRDVITLRRSVAVSRTKTVSSVDNDPTASTPAARHKLAALVAIAALVAAMGVTTYLLDAERAAAATEVRAAFGGSITLGELATAMVDTETGQRAYLLMGEPEFLEPYTQARARLGFVLDRLSQRFGDVEPMRDLERDVETTLSLLDRSIALADAHELGRAKLLLLESKDAMDRVRRDLARLEMLEEDRRRIADARRALAAERGQITVLATSLLVIVLLLLVAYAIRGDLRVILRQKDDLAARQAELEARGARLEQLSAELASRNTHLGRVNEALALAVEERAAATASLERRNRDLDQFAYVTSHDLKAPLRAIGNLVSWIEEDLGEQGSDSVREHLGLLKQRADRMNTLIEGILTYSRAGRQTKLEDVSLASAVTHVVELLGLPEGAVVQRGLELTLCTDRTQLEQVLQNLIGNARKHAADAREPIEIDWRALDERRVEISVRDHGPGIEPRFHDRIFEIFQTLAPRDRVEGTGIGLSIVKKLVLAQGGSIKVASSPGDGATFSFTWPRTPAAAAEGAST